MCVSKLTLGPVILRPVKLTPFVTDQICTAYATTLYSCHTHILHNVVHHCIHLVCVLLNDGPCFCSVIAASVVVVTSKLNLVQENGCNIPLLKFLRHARWVIIKHKNTAILWTCSTQTVTAGYVMASKLMMSSLIFSTRGSVTHWSTASTLKKRHPATAAAIATAQ